MSHNAVEIITFHFALSSSPDVSTFADILLQKKRKKVYICFCQLLVSYS